MYTKQFDKWNDSKKNLDCAMHKPPLFKEREVWWCAYGVNVGSEVCGKNNYFRRPVLVIKKLSQNSFVGVPLSTKANIGSWYVSITHSNGEKNTVNLAQVRYIDYRRLDKKISSLDSVEFMRVKASLKELLGL